MVVVVVLGLYVVPSVLCVYSLLRGRCFSGTGDLFFLMILRPPRSTLDRSSAASDVYKRQGIHLTGSNRQVDAVKHLDRAIGGADALQLDDGLDLSLIHISEPTRPY